MDWRAQQAATRQQRERIAVVQELVCCLENLVYLVRSSQDGGPRVRIPVLRHCESVTAKARRGGPWGFEQAGSTPARSTTLLLAAAHATEQPVAARFRALLEKNDPATVRSNVSLRVNDASPHGVGRDGAVGVPSGDGTCIRCDKPATVWGSAPWGRDGFCSEECMDEHGQDVTERDAQSFFGGR